MTHAREAELLHGTTSNKQHRIFDHPCPAGSFPPTTRLPVGPAYDSRHTLASYRPNREISDIDGVIMPPTRPHGSNWSRLIRWLRGWECQPPASQSLREDHTTLICEHEWEAGQEARWSNRAAAVVLATVRMSGLTDGSVRSILVDIYVSTLNR